MCAKLTESFAVALVVVDLGFLSSFQKRNNLGVLSQFSFFFCTKDNYLTFSTLGFVSSATLQA